MKCRSCGVSLKVDAKFCGRCGAPVEAVEPDGVRCPTCGTVNRTGAKFCQRDGTALQSPAPPPAEDRSATASVSERAAVEAHETASTRPKERAAHVAPAAGPSSLPRPPLGGIEAAPGDAGRSRLWPALGAGVVLAAAAGGYWFYTHRSVPDTATDNAAALGELGVTTPEAGVPNDAVTEPREPATSSATPAAVASTSVEAPRLSVGDRWVTEVVDHQDSTLSYRAERTVTNVGPDRIWTEVRTLGKDYARLVEYTGEWALVATHLQSGVTTSYAPALPYLDFPLQTGKTWQARITESDAEGLQRVHDVRATVESWETVQVPAGRFNALRISLTDEISKDGVLVQQGRDVSWYAPEVRRTVKTEETSIDSATGERRRRTISLLEFSVHGGGSGGAGGYTATRDPPAEVVSDGACPFEGCQLGEWTAREPAALYDRPNGVQTSAIRAGDRVVALEAQVRAQPHRAVVTRVYQTDEQQGIHVGDVVYALYPLGEGAVAVWHAGQVKEGSLELGLRFDNKTESPELKYVWWVHVRRSDGTMGWLKDPHGFDGMDALG